MFMVKAFNLERLLSCLGCTLYTCSVFLNRMLAAGRALKPFNKGLHRCFTGHDGLLDAMFGEPDA